MGIRMDIHAVFRLGHWCIWASGRLGFGVGVLVFEHLGVGGCSGVRELAGVGVHALRRAFERSQVRGTASYEGVGAAHRPGIPAVCWLWLHSSFVLARSTLRRHCVGQLGSLHGSKEGGGAVVSGRVAMGMLFALTWWLTPRRRRCVPC